MTDFIKAAQIILEEKGNPMSAFQITKEAIQKDIISTKGKTPERSMGARIYMDIKKKGDQSLFYKSEKGYFGLRKWKNNKFTDFSFKDAALKVLTENNKPLSFHEITNIALKKGYLKTEGKTPERSMGAQLYTDIKSQGDKSLFVQLGKNRFGLRSWNIDVIKEEILKKEKEETKEASLIRQRSIVGDPIQFEGLMYGPLNENGVIFLFSKIHKKLGIIIEAVQPSYPDAKARRKTPKGWEDVWIEFEYKSSSFKVHKHDPKECDIIVCWENDWKDCPIEVIELKEIIKKL
ncbi:MAG: hypothetical protein COY73_03775 [Candidatus Nealsonbacteria bacterium CG_4_10_14_0_8_um_filter_37_14]|uniref:HTH HARE-type domain-containing protein n=1 Tax=Candidatus Nealsonbacteria bacterium CG_4_10_14_0_8_um_filter_37_14 TaxID=1974684 RepID=A0A2M7R594_9BACT|nr:MAG: hypothetical protein COY73_03775 [Candidatus Nealsonbacteria bacterium CG_4_10_14_0_8_um_filter_37_14]